MNADSILRLIKRIFGNNFPVLKETYREIVEDSMDIENAEDYLSKIENKEIKIKIVRTPYPSPFSLNLYILGEEDIVLMEDRRKILKLLHEKILEVVSSSLPYQKPMRDWERAEQTRKGR